MELGMIFGENPVDRVVADVFDARLGNPHAERYGKHYEKERKSY